MIIERYIPQQEKHLQHYEMLFAKTFGELKPHRLPDIVYEARKGDKVGWAGGFIRKPGEMFLQSGGVPMKQHGWPGNVRGYQRLLQFIHDDGYESLMNEVENTNIPYLKLALTSGFLINGARVASDGTVILEMYKRRGDTQ